jgi:hypothetical protein
LKYSPDITFFLAPYVNSYKRFLPGTFAPTKIAWSIDNRTAGYRLVGDGTKAVRIECRIPGSDINPYLACAAQLAAGLKRHRGRVEPGCAGDRRRLWHGGRAVHSAHAARGDRNLAQLIHAARRRWATGSSIIIRGRRKSSRKRSTRW